jgi:hypothetical protein
MSNFLNARQMRYRSIIVLAVACSMISYGFSVFAADEDSQTEEEDSSAGLPEQYAKNYLIAGSTISPDKKFAVIYPTLQAEEAADSANNPEGIKTTLLHCSLLLSWASYKRSILTSKMRVMAGSARNGRMTARSR